MHGFQAHPGEEERKLRAGHVGDHQVARTEPAHGAKVDSELHGRSGDGRWEGLRDGRGHRAVPDGSLLGLGQLAGGDHPAQTVKRSRQVVGQRDEHGRELVAQRVVLRMAAHGDRHHRDQRVGGLHVVFGEIGAQRPCTRGEYDVIDGEPQSVPQLLDLGQAQFGERHRPIRLHGRGERGGCPQWDGEPGRSTTGGVAGQTQCGASDLPGGPDNPQRTAEQVGQGFGDQPHSRWCRRRLPGFDDLGSHGPLRADVEQLGQHPGSRDTVKEGVMDLGNQSDPAVVEPFNDVHLPGSLIRVERVTHDVGHQIAQPFSALRRRQCGPVQMVAQVELGVVHPAGVIQAHGHRHETAPEGGQRREPRRQVVPDGVERIPARGRRRVEHAGIGHLHGTHRGLRVDEHRVNAAHSLHGGRLP